MKFAHPLWLFGTLLAFAVAGLLVWGAFRGIAALRRFGEENLVEGLLTARVGSRRAIKGALSVTGLACCFVALAQPQYGWGTRRIPATNLDVVIVLDYSKSMYARDVAPSRIERAKSEVARLITELRGARFGAVAFAGEPMSFPLTSDGGAIAQFFRQLTPHDMPVGGTAIARALEAGRSLLERDPQSSKHRRVMMLVTDGEDLEGDPTESARSAKAAGIAIHVVQIGGRTPEPIPDVDEHGIDRGLRRNERGQVMTTALTADGEKQLAQIAELSLGNVVQSIEGNTGIEEVARRLRALMTEELSERVETVYADVYAYPLGAALLLLALEAFVPEVRPRRRKKPGTAATVATSKGRVIAASLVLVLASGCESRAVDRVFTRHAPEVDEAIELLESRDAGAAERELVGYLGIGRCKDGNIGASAALADRPQASFDLGLTLFSLGERYGARFGEDPGSEQEDPALLARRSAEVGCALSVVQQIAGRSDVPLPLRARSYYLLGNLDFLRREYRAAVAAYDHALELVPGQDDASEGVGRDAAHNRAIALRLAKEEEEKKKPPEQPDGGAPNSADGGDSPEQPPKADAGNNDSQDQKSDQSDKQKQDDQGDEQKSEQEQKQDPSDQKQEQPGDQPEPSPQEAKDGQENQPNAPPPREPSLSQDEKVLDQLERAPALQQEAARAQRGRVRRVVEDK